MGKPSSSKAKPAKQGGAGQVAQPHAGPMPMWVFTVAALIMAGVAFIVITAGRAPSSAVDLPLANISNSTGGPMALPMIGKPELAGGHYTGNAGADVALVEYSDFQCPYCGRVVPALEKVKADYPQIKFAFRHFPLSIHQNAQKAAEASECAGMQGKFWEMHDRLFANQDDLGVSSLKAYAAGLGLDATAFNRCLDTGQAAGIVDAEKLEGQGTGIRGTPGFLAFSMKGRNSTIEQRLYAISDRFRGLGVSSAVVEVQGAGPGIVFAGAMPYSDYKAVLDAFN